MSKVELAFVTEGNDVTQGFVLGCAYAAVNEVTLFVPHQLHNPPMPFMPVEEYRQLVGCSWPKGDATPTPAAAAVLHGLAHANMHEKLYDYHRGIDIAPVYDENNPGFVSSIAMRVIHPDAVERLALILAHQLAPDATRVLVRVI